MVIQYSLPAILLAGSFFFPESAYFLIKKGKTQAAKNALQRTYGSKDKEFLDIEYKRLTENVRFSEELKMQAALGGPLLTQCFRGTNLVPSPHISNVRGVPSLQFFLPSLRNGSEHSSLLAVVLVGCI